MALYTFMLQSLLSDLVWSDISNGQQRYHHHHYNWLFRLDQHVLSVPSTESSYFRFASSRIFLFFLS
jgi:hypothetical protein